jgi:hypothetical protein
MNFLLIASTISGSDLGPRSFICFQSGFYFFHGDKGPCSLRVGTHGKGIALNVEHYRAVQNPGSILSDNQIQERKSCASRTLFCKKYCGS